MFKFMSVMTKKAPGIDANPTKLLTLFQHERDMFLDIFARDFCKLSEALEAKTNAKKQIAG